MNIRKSEHLAQDKDECEDAYTLLGKYGFARSLGNFSPWCPYLMSPILKYFLYALLSNVRRPKY